MNALTSITSPPREPSAADHVTGFVVAIASTIIGGLLTPFLALAFVAAQPVLVVAAVLRARGEDEIVAGKTAARHAA